MSAFLLWLLCLAGQCLPRRPRPSRPPVAALAPIGAIGILPADHPDAGAVLWYRTGYGQPWVKLCGAIDRPAAWDCLEGLRPHLATSGGSWCVLPRNLTPDAPWSRP